MMQLRCTVLPLPAAPAIRRWGILARSAATTSPAGAVPRAMASFDCALSFWKALLSITLFRETEVVMVLGMPAASSEARV